MAKPYKTKFTMRSPEEKERIILEYFNDQHQSYRKTADKYEMGYSYFRRLIKKYREHGIDGLRSRTGKTKNLGKGNHLSHLQRKKNKTKEEELQLKVMELEIEVARLKKGTK